MFGWKLVPIAPTQDQIHAAYKEQPEAINVGFAQAYRTMIVNAPPAPPAAEPFIWICLVAANAEGDADPDPRIRAWTANGARAAQLAEQGLDMVPVYRNPPARSSAVSAPRAWEAIDPDLNHNATLTRDPGVAEIWRKAGLTVRPLYSDPPQTALVPASADEIASFLKDEFSSFSAGDARSIARTITDKYSVSRPKSQ